MIWGDHNMGIQILKVERESYPATRFIGKSFERYNCSIFTTPNANGNVILDYAVSIEV